MNRKSTGIGRGAAAKKIAAVLLAVVLTAGALVYVPEPGGRALAESSVGTESEGSGNEAGEMPADQEASTGIEGDYDFSSSEGNFTQVTDHFVYRDDCFTVSSFEGCRHLAVLSAQVMLASFARYGDPVKAKEQGIDCAENIKEMLENMGFSDVAANSYYNMEKEVNSIGVAVGRRVIEAGGKEYTLIAVVPRSSGYKQEWGGNFTVGDGDVHEGFKEARDECLRFVKKYIEDNSISGDIKIWTAGHSRGGAVACMIAGFLADGGISYLGDGLKLQPEDVYCYTYGAPVCIKDGAEKAEVLSVSAARGGEYTGDTPGETYVSDAEGNIDLSDDVYGGIRNFISDNDLVPMLPPAEWGFGRYGTNISVDNEGKTAFDDTAEILGDLNPFVSLLFEAGDYRAFKAKTIGFPF